MRNLLMTCAAAVLFAAMATASSAGEPAGAISKATLDQMGLGNMTMLAERDALAVRGMGTRVRVYGPTYNVTRSHFAARGNFSITPSGKFSGGRSIAWAR